MKNLVEMKETMTSVELFTMLDYSKLNNLHTALSNMFEDEIKEGLEIQPTLRPNGQVEFYTLNELLSKMFVASKNKSYLRKITQYWIDKKVPTPKQIEVQPENMFMALDLMTKALNLPESGKLQAYAIGMQDYPRFVQALPSYAVDKPIIDHYVEVNTSGSSGVTHALSYHLKNLNVGKSAVSINKLLRERGFLERRERVSSKGTIKYFNAITDEGLRYGKNITNPKSQRETQPHYYDSMIKGLLLELY